VIILRIMKWAENVVLMVARRAAYRDLLEKNLKEGDHLEDPGIDVRIILRRIFRIEELEGGGGMD